MLYAAGTGVRYVPPRLSNAQAMPALAIRARNVARTEAFRTNCTIVVVDRPARKVVGEQLFSAEPPRTIDGNPERFVAPRPDAAILRFLTSLEAQ